MISHTPILKNYHYHSDGKRYSSARIQDTILLTRETDYNGRHYLDTVARIPAYCPIRLRDTPAYDISPLHITLAALSLAKS